MTYDIDSVRSKLDPADSNPHKFPYETVINVQKVIAELEKTSTNKGAALVSQGIQVAINQAMTTGHKLTSGEHALPMGAVVYFPPGKYIINEPIILPPSDANGRVVVHLIGSNYRTTIIEGETGVFPNDRGLIEWSPFFPEKMLTRPGEEIKMAGTIFNNLQFSTSHQPAHFQRIEGFTLVLPKTCRSMAIYRPFPKLRLESFAKLCAVLKVNQNFDDFIDNSTGKVIDELISGELLAIQPGANPGLRFLLKLFQIKDQVFIYDNSFERAWFDNSGASLTKKEIVDAFIEPVKVWIEKIQNTLNPEIWKIAARKWRDVNLKRLVDDELIEKVEYQVKHSHEIDEGFVFAFARWQIYFSTLTNEASFRLHVILENIIITGNNTYHESLIRLQGSIFRSTIRNIIADCSPHYFDHKDMARHMPKHDTVILYLDEGDPVHYGADLSGFQLGRIEHVHGGHFSSGYHKIFQGRINQSSWHGCFADGTFKSPSFDFRNSVDSVFFNIATEGRADKPIFKLTNCHGLSFKKIGLGTTYSQSLKGGNFDIDINGITVVTDDDFALNLELASNGGNGVELHDCASCEFDGRSLMGGEGHSLHGYKNGEKIIVMDKFSRRNIVRNFELEAELDLETKKHRADNYFEIDSPEWNYVSAFVYVMGADDEMFAIGTHPDEWPGMP